MDNTSVGIKTLMAIAATSFVISGVLAGILIFKFFGAAGFVIFTIIMFGLSYPITILYANWKQRSKEESTNDPTTPTNSL